MNDAPGWQGDITLSGLFSSRNPGGEGEGKGVVDLALGAPRVNPSLLPVVLVLAPIVSSDVCPRRFPPLFILITHSTRVHVRCAGCVDLQDVLGEVVLVWEKREVFRPEAFRRTALRKRSLSVDDVQAHVCQTGQFVRQWEVQEVGERNYNNYSVTEVLPRSLFFANPMYKSIFDATSSTLFSKPAAVTRWSPRAPISTPSTSIFRLAFEIVEASCRGSSMHEKIAHATAFGRSSCGRGVLVPSSRLSGMVPHVLCSHASSGSGPMTRSRGSVIFA